MNVTLIDYTGADSEDQLYAARLLVYTKNTRLSQGADTRHKIWNMDIDELHHELDYIARTIRSSWEFVDYTFEVQGVTRAFTHQLVRTRTASYAQQAQRVVNMSEFEVLKPDTVKESYTNNLAWDDAIHQIKDCYQQLFDAGVPPQDCRGILPTNVLTNIIVKMNLRTFADLCGKRDNPRAQGEYVDVVRAMKKAVLEVHPWAKSFLEPERTATPHLDKIMAELAQGEVYHKPELNAALKEIDALKGTWG